MTGASSLFSTSSSKHMSMQSTKKEEDPGGNKRWSVFNILGRTSSVSAGDGRTTSPAGGVTNLMATSDRPTSSDKAGARNSALRPVSTLFKKPLKPYEQIDNEWTAILDPDTNTYYYWNKKKSITSWEHPHAGKEAGGVRTSQGSVSSNAGKTLSTSGLKPVAALPAVKEANSPSGKGLQPSESTKNFASAAPAAAAPTPTTAQPVHFQIDDEWISILDPAKNKHYYWNTKTGVTQWVHPNPGAADTSAAAPAPAESNIRESPAPARPAPVPPRPQAPVAAPAVVPPPRGPPAGVPPPVVALPRGPPAVPPPAVAPPRGPPAVAAPPAVPPPRGPPAGAVPPPRGPPAGAPAVPPPRGPPSAPAPPRGPPAPPGKPGPPAMPPRGPPPPVAAAPAAAESGGDPSEDPYYKYIKMRNMNLPEGAIRQKMMTDGLSPDEQDAFFA